MKTQITFTFANGCVATLRTSGTEPKIKYYVELHGGDPAEVTRELGDLVRLLVEDMMQPGS